jgi:hypothetical protein
MLPGFRFLFAAVVLSMSILVFGLGAAALLRTAHEEFANTPSWQPAPETRFVQSAAAPLPATQPVLAMLRVDDPPKDASKQAADTDQPAPNVTVTTDATDQPAVAAEPAPQPDQIAALRPADSPPETAKPEAPTSEAPATDSAPQAEAAPAPADTSAAPDDATRLAATEPAPAPTSEAAPTGSAEAVAAAPEQPNAPSGAEANTISTRIATLGGPPVTIATPAANAASAKSDSSAVKKRRSRAELRRRRSAARARLARQTQTLDAFGQPTTTAR